MFPSGGSQLGEKRQEFSDLLFSFKTLFKRDNAKENRNGVDVNERSEPARPLWLCVHPFVQVSRYAANLIVTSFFIRIAAYLKHSVLVVVHFYKENLLNQSNHFKSCDPTQISRILPAYQQAGFANKYIGQKACIDAIRLPTGTTNDSLALETPDSKHFP